VGCCSTSIVFGRFVVCDFTSGDFTCGFVVKAFTPTYDREIASSAAMPIPIGLSFRASQTCGFSSTSADLRVVTGTFGSGMTFGITGAGFSTGGRLTGAFATAFFSSRVLATIGDTTAAGFSDSLTAFFVSSCIGAAGATFGRASAGLDTISGAAGLETGTGAGFSIARFDSTLLSEPKGTFGEAGGTRSAGRAGGVTGIAGATGISFGRASTGSSISGAGAFETGAVAGGATGVSIARFDSTFAS